MGGKIKLKIRSSKQSQKMEDTKGPRRERDDQQDDMTDGHPFSLDFVHSFLAPDQHSQIEFGKGVQIILTCNCTVDDILVTW